jgi:hypothetical protein
MLCFVHPDLGFLQETRDPSPLRLADPKRQLGREPLRHILLGPPTGVRQAINTLHVLNYADQAIWSQLIQVPTTGILILPEQGEVMSYLIRYRPRE